MVLYVCFDAICLTTYFFVRSTMTNTQENRNYDLLSCKWLAYVPSEEIVIWWKFWYVAPRSSNSGQFLSSLWAGSTTNNLLVAFDVEPGGVGFCCAKYDDSFQLLGPCKRSNSEDRFRLLLIRWFGLVAMLSRRLGRLWYEERVREYIIYIYYINILLLVYEW